MIIIYLNVFCSKCIYKIGKVIKEYDMVCYDNSFIIL